MKKLLLSLAAAAAVGAAAAPAAAQSWGDHDRYGRYDRHDRQESRLTTSYVDGLDWKITNAARYGIISWGQARDLRGQLRSVQPLAYRVQTGQARPWEVNRLAAVVDRIDSLTSGYAYNNRRDRDDHRWRR